jgi:hypothetical protein
LHALAGVKREIRLTDRAYRRKYLRDFSEAFRSYESVMRPGELKNLVAASDLVLIGDYHALPACQRFTAGILEEVIQPAGRPVVLAVETIFARDQHILDEWWRREIDETELRRRIRFDVDWGYEWAPFYELLLTARDQAEAIYGLDCMPREDLRKIGARDRHAAHKIAEMRQAHPDAVILVLFGESHLAPGHLPRCLREQMPEQKTLTILQNLDALYWQAAGEPDERVEAVRVAQDTVCVFNSTPLEKYENYRLHLSRWGHPEEDGPDLAPTIYNLVDSLLRFLGINRYSSRNGTQPKFLVDLLPEVFSDVPEEQLRRLLQSETPSEEENAKLLRKIEECGSVYLPRSNALYVRNFQMMYAAEEVARFLHSACRGMPAISGKKLSQPVDLFYTRTVEHALGYFGSRVLYPARPAARRGTEAGLAAREALAEESAQALEAQAQAFGYTLGSNLYDRYLDGGVSRSALRRLFLAHLEEPGLARKICAELNHYRGLGRKGPYPDHRAQPRSTRSRLA